MGNKTLISLLCLIVILSLGIPTSPTILATPELIYVTDDYSSIQAAVEGTSQGDTIVGIPSTMRS